MTYYSRKSPRIPNYDYSNQNYYFITICTHNRKCIFGNPNHLNDLGKIVKRHIDNISSFYYGVLIDKYVVMPNHIHMIICVSGDGNPDVSQIVGQFKIGVTKEIRQNNPNMEIWQRSYHDHIIRNQKSYENIWLYIDGNPQCWDKDCFYIEPNVERFL